MNDHRNHHESDDAGIALLSRWRSDVPAPTDDELAAVRRRVLADDGGGAAPSMPRRRRALVAVAAAVTAAVLVVPAAAGQLWPTEESSLSAAELLNGAADELIASTDLTVGPGQWLHITTEGGAADPSQDDAGGIFGGPQHSEQWVPHDQSGDWYLFRPDHYSPTPYVVARGGDFYGPDQPREGTWGNPTPEFYASVPRDTEALRALLYPGKGYAGGATPTPDPTETHSPDQRVFSKLADILREGLVPADLRASLYRVLAGVPGVVVTDDAVVMDGRTGVAFGLDDPTGGYTDQIVIDPGSGRYVGERGLEADGTVVWNSSMAYEVVDEVPAEVVTKARRVPWVPCSSIECAPPEIRERLLEQGQG